MILVLCLQLSVFSQGCLPNGIIFNNQVSIDNFQSDYPSCKKIIGDVLISGSDIVNLNSLSNIEEIHGFLEINDNTNLPGIEGLKSLTKVGKHVAIRNNNTLVELDGLRSLRNIEDGNFSFVNNPSVMDLIGLHTITVVYGDVLIDSIPRIKSLYGLNSLYNVIGTLTISHNDSLESLEGLGNLTYIDELVIKENHQINNLLGLSSIYQKNTDFVIESNNSIEDLSGMGFLVSVGSLKLTDNISLERISDMNLKIIRGDLTLTNNGGIQNLSGFDSLNYILGHINITNNDVLVSLQGIDFIYPDSIESVTINNNPLLTQCEIESICSYIALPFANIEVFDNNANCNSVVEIDTACLYSSATDVSTELLLPYPNPTKGKIWLKSASLSHIDRISVYNHQGIQLKVENTKNGYVDLSDYVPGIYFVEVIIDNTRYMYKIFKIE